MDETKMKEKENTVNEEITQENKETFSDGWGKIQRNAYQLTHGVIPLQRPFFSMGETSSLFKRY